MNIDDVVAQVDAGRLEAEAQAAAAAEEARQAKLAKANKTKPAKGAKTTTPGKAGSGLGAWRRRGDSRSIFVQQAINDFADDEVPDPPAPVSSAPLAVAAEPNRASVTTLPEPSTSLTPTTRNHLKAVSDMAIIEPELTNDADNTELDDVEDVEYAEIVTDPTPTQVFADWAPLKTAQLNIPTPEHLEPGYGHPDTLGDTVAFPVRFGSDDLDAATLAVASQQWQARATKAEGELVAAVARAEAAAGRLLVHRKAFEGEASRLTALVATLESGLAAKTSEAQATQTNMQAALDAAQGDLATAQLELANTRQALADTAQSAEHQETLNAALTVDKAKLTAQYEQQVAQINVEYQGQKSLWETEITSRDQQLANLETSYQTALAELEAQHANEITQLENRNRETVAFAQSLQAQEALCLTQIRELEATIGQLKTESATRENQTATLIAELEAELVTTRQELANAVLVTTRVECRAAALQAETERLTQTHTAELAQVRAASDSEKIHLRKVVKDLDCQLADAQAASALSIEQNSALTAELARSREQAAADLETAAVVAEQHQANLSAEHARQIAELENNYARELADAETNNAQLISNAAQYQNQIRELETRIETLTAQVTVQEKTALQVAGLESELAAARQELANLKLVTSRDTAQAASLQTEIENLTIQHGAELSEIRAAHDAEQAHLTSVVETLDRQLADAQATNLLSIERVEQLTAELTQTRTEAEARLTELDAVLEQRRAQVQATAALEIAELGARHAAEVAELETRYANELTELDTTHRSALVEVESQWQTRNLALEAQLDELETAAIANDQAAQAKIGAVAQELASTRAELHLTINELNDSNSNIEQLQQKLDNANADYSARVKYAEMLESELTSLRLRESDRYAPTPANDLYEQQIAQLSAELNSARRAAEWATHSLAVAEQDYDNRINNLIAEFESAQAEYAAHADNTGTQGLVVSDAETVTSGELSLASATAGPGAMATAGKPRRTIFGLAAAIALLGGLAAGHYVVPGRADAHTLNRIEAAEINLGMVLEATSNAQDAADRANVAVGNAELETARLAAEQAQAEAAAALAAKAQAEQELAAARAATQARETRSASLKTPAISPAPAGSGATEAQAAPVPSTPALPITGETASASIGVTCTENAIITFTATGDGHVTLNAGGQSASGDGAASITFEGTGSSGSASAADNLNISWSAQTYGECS